MPARMSNRVQRGTVTLRSKGKQGLSRRSAQTGDVDTERKGAMLENGGYTVLSGAGLQRTFYGAVWIVRLLARGAWRLLARDCM